MLWLVVGLVIFLGVHSVRIVAPAWREARIAAGGEGAFKGIYSILSAAGLVLIVWGYGKAWENPVILYDPPVWTRHLAALLMLFSFISLAVYALPAGRLKPLLKHPMLLAVKIWALAHLIANGDLASVVLFGAFLLWAAADRVAAKRRGAGAPKPGPATMDLAAIALGAVLYLLFVWRLHVWLIGVAPFS
ncbi:MAG TPA: NnrU family protein [Rhizobiales bacterium]|nr:NnrU family protein [Hyphomicrobiales bacterium]